jgi:GeoRSP system PqqD family protein
MFQLNLVGAEIWKRCDGTMTREEIVEAILPSMEVEPEVLARDVAAFLEEMRSRGWLR